MDHGFKLPAALEPYKAHRIWVVHKNKVPHQPDNPSMLAKNNDPKTWSDAATAISVALEHDFDGIGINLKDGEIGGFDIDHCRDPETGEIDPYARKLVADANTYTEISPSGTGLHVFGLYWGEPKQGKKQSVPGANGVSVESYRKLGRYVTVTGNHLAGTPNELNDITDLIEATVAELEKANAKAAQHDEAEEDDDGEELPASLTARLFIPDGGAGKRHGDYATRSELLIAFITDCLRARVGAKRIVRACLDEAHRGHAVYEHCRDNGGRDYVLRQIERARGLIQQGLYAEVAELNKDHALVLAANKAAVMMFEMIDGREQFRLLQVGAFKQFFANKQVTVGRRVTSIAEYWMSHPQRRQYKGIEFAPGRKDRDSYHNLWHGFTVAPHEGDCSKFLDHLRDNVAQGNIEHFNWIVAWWAQIFQEPTVKPGTALVIRGKQGAGKTKVGEVFGSLLGDHYELVADPRYITGQFNSHMSSLVVLHADEAFWAGDKRAEGKLKDLITGHKHRLEFKGVDPILVDNYIRLFVTANHGWLVPAGFDERRFAVFDIGEDCVRDHAFFAAIDHEMDNGGREALLHYLLSFDRSRVNLREIPRTAALLEQIIATATPEQAWWFDTLMSGTLPFGLNEANTCPKKTLYRRYVRHAQLQGARRREIETKLGIFLKRFVGPELDGEKKKQYTVRHRHGHLVVTGYVYVFPSLKDCRERYANQIGQKVLWGEPTEWEHEPAAEAEDDELPM
jgi:hypothetical protein